MTGAERTPRVIAAGLVLVVAGVHFQQYVSFMSRVPTVGILFLLNAAGGGAIAVALLGGDRLVRAGAALGAIGLCLGSLVSIVIALESSFFGYAEPSLRLAIVIAIVAELAVLPLAAILARRDGVALISGRRAATA